ncbi:hypothetical protein BDB00DRAFT_817618 [Zychaea mexicana]|uniref:uncharacterized protein n=1 Tax=Zychaea mexicana TaxID=64656 RepID=UPI0022FE6A71|nr:uncharacterized protein BDB00DRAFT_817618 [Zychaea mexicana]KAI9494637.1 hypothetical protein BDB00DRAFT_817618 [Zychaea mexicana]
MSKSSTTDQNPGSSSDLSTSESPQHGSDQSNSASSASLTIASENQEGATSSSSATYSSARSQPPNSNSLSDQEQQQLSASAQGASHPTLGRVEQSSTGSKRTHEDSDDEGQPGHSRSPSRRRTQPHDVLYRQLPTRTPPNILALLKANCIAREKNDRKLACLHRRLEYLKTLYTMVKEVEEQQQQRQDALPILSYQTFQERYDHVRAEFHAGSAAERASENQGSGDNPSQQQ